MSLTFSTLTVGDHGPVLPDQWELPSQINSQFGLKGATVLTAAIQTRAIAVDIWFHNSHVTRASLVTSLQTLDDLGGTTDTLTVSGTSYGECEFLGFQQQGQLFYSTGQTSWLAIGQLLFRQLEPQ